MSSLNKIILFGSITQDVVFKESTDGEPLVRFDLRVSRPSRTDGLPSGEDTVPVVGKRSMPDKCRELKSGSSLMVEGRVITGRQNLEDGTVRYFTEVELLNFSCVTQPSSNEGPTQQDVAPSPAAPAESSSSTPLENKAVETADFSFDQQVNKQEAELEETVPF